MILFPSASAAKRAARWEMDLSPGIFAVPDNLLPGEMVIFMADLPAVLRLKFPPGGWLLGGAILSAQRNHYDPETFAVHPNVGGMHLVRPIHLCDWL